MAYVSDGSRLCDSNRTALAAIDADFTLVTAKTVPVIFCAAIMGALGDRMRDGGVGTFTLHWRRAGGTFAAITASSEVKIAQATGATVLVQGTAVTATTARCLESALIEAGIEVEAVASSTSSPLIELQDNLGAEWQIALDLSAALDGQQYEFRGVCVHDGGTTNIDYATAVTTPAALIALRPDADVSAGSWTSTGGNLYSVVDEASANDADAITSAAVPVDDVAEVALENPSTTSTGVTTIYARVKKT